MHLHNVLMLLRRGRSSSHECGAHTQCFDLSSCWNGADGRERQSEHVYLSAKADIGSDFQVLIDLTAVKNCAWLSMSEWIWNFGCTLRDHLSRYPPQRVSSRHNFSPRTAHSRSSCLTLLLHHSNTGGLFPSLCVSLPRHYSDVGWKSLEMQ